MSFDKLFLFALLCFFILFFFYFVYSVMEFIQEHLGERGRMGLQYDPGQIRNCIVYCMYAQLIAPQLCL